MADYDWDAPASGDVREAAGPSVDAWDTGDMASALPTDGEHDNDGNEGKSSNGDAAATTTVPHVPVVPVVPEACPGWIRPSPYDYSSDKPENWESNARVYEWDGEEGDVGPEVDDLELMLFGDPNVRHPSHGIDFSA